MFREGGILHPWQLKWVTTSRKNSNATKALKQQTVPSIEQKASITFSQLLESDMQPNQMGPMANGF